MSKKDDRRLVACEECERTYPGFRREGGDLHIVGGPACPNCRSSSFVEVEFGPSLALSCPNCGTEHRETVDLPYDTDNVERTHHRPDGVVEVTCAECEEVFDVGYETGT